MNKDSIILVTGGTGFLGTHLMAKLKAKGYTNVLTPHKTDYDLTEQGQVRQLLAAFSPEVIVHLAAVVGGIGANMHNPGRFFYDNLIMGIMLMEEARRANVQKFVALGTACSYPKFAPVPFPEDSLFKGYPEETNAPYGLAKLMLLVQSQAYRAQYGFNAIHLIPVNLYGPNDHFDLDSCHVIPALIRKCVEARELGEKELVVWGNGSATREFLYAEDAADGIIAAMENYSGSEPVNLGSGMEINIKELAEMIVELTGFSGKIVWDTSKPNGQPRRCLDSTYARQVLSFEPKVSLHEGLKRTVNWYLANRKSTPDKAKQERAFQARVNR